MGIAAVALVKIPHATLVKPLTAHTDKDRPELDHVYLVRRGRSVRITPLDDASLVWTGASFGLEPDELGLVVRQWLGDALDAHSDPRGVFVFPDVAAPKTRTYDAVIDEIGEVGFWVPRVAEGYVPKPVPAPPPDTTDHAHGADAANPLRDLMSAVPADTMAALAQAMASGDAAAMARAQEQMQQALSAHGGIEALQQSMSELLSQMGGPAGLFGDAGDDDDAPGGMPGGLPFDLPSEEAAPELWAQARAQLEAMQRDNPELLAQLQQQFGLSGNLFGPDGGEDDEDGDEGDAPGAGAGTPPPRKK